MTSQSHALECIRRVLHDPEDSITVYIQKDEWGKTPPIRSGPLVPTLLELADRDPHRTMYYRIIAYGPTHIYVMVVYDSYRVSFEAIPKEYPESHGLLPMVEAGG